MWAKRLIWVFGAGFILFGLPLIMVEDAAARDIWGSLSTFSLGGFAFAMAYDAAATGTIRMQFSTINRAAQPRAFWAAVGLVTLAGLGVVIAAGWLLFFKN